MTSWPSSTRLVDAASADRIVQPSWIPSGGCPGGPEMRWSQTQRESIPIASACVAKARTSSHLGIRPGPSDCDIGTTTPTFTARSLG